MDRDLGRHAYGLASAAAGAITLYFWRDAIASPQVQALGAGSLAAALLVAAAVAIAGGVAIQWRATARLGAVALGAVYLFLAVLFIPHIVTSPLVYDHWGNFFEQFSMFSGALLLYATLVGSRSRSGARMARIACIAFGVSVVSFTLEQAFYLRATADLVPTWIPPGQMFWAVATTIAFGLAAVAILSGRQALLASRLLTLMILLFGVLIWIPRLLLNPHTHFTWSETAETFTIAGVAWMLADYLGAGARLGMRRNR